MKMVSKTTLILFNKILLLMMKAVIGQMWDNSTNPFIEQNITDSCEMEINEGIYYKQKVLIANCSFSTLESIPSDIPESVEVLNLSGNRLCDRYSAIIIKYENLKEIDLSDNTISLMNIDISNSNLSTIVYLNLGNNFISTLFKGDFSYFTGLEYISLSCNQINYIDDEAFSSLINLKYIILENNSITSLSNKWFQGLTNLVTLNLRYNHISHIPTSVFQDLSSLDNLLLSGNVISTIDPRSFSGLINLRMLALTDNHIISVPTAAFQSLPNLRILIMDKNPIAKIKPLDFSHLPVSNISLCEMPNLRIVDSKAFYNLGNLSYLYITNNLRLIYIDPQAIDNINSIKGLYLHKNRLRGLHPIVSENTANSINITLHGNPFHCDCNIRWIQQLLTINNTWLKKHIVISNVQDILCKTPRGMENKSILVKSLANLPKTCPPTFLEDSNSHKVKGALGEHQVLECRSIGIPRPQMHWILPDESIINSTLNEVRRRFFPPDTLVYYHLEPMDMGKYTCVAENSAGSTSKTTVLYMKGIDINLYAKVLKNHISLTWNGSDILSFPAYSIRFKDILKLDENMTELVIVNSTQLSYKIENMNNTSTHRYCLGYNNNNDLWFQLSCCDILAQSTNFSMIKLTFIVIVTLFLAFSIVSLVCIVICCCRKKTHSSNDKCNEKCLYENKISSQPVYKCLRISKVNESKKFLIRTFGLSEKCSSQSQIPEPEISSISKRLSFGSSEVIGHQQSNSSDTHLPFSTEGEDVKLL